MFYSMHNPERGLGPNVSSRCPFCGKIVTLETIKFPNSYQKDIKVGNVSLGQRKCANPECNAHIFVILQDNKLLHSIPSQKIDFDKKRIPSNVVKVFEEVITCHANSCFIASAIMVRKTLEEICHDQGAVGDNLKARIIKLKEKLVIPVKLIAGMDNLRLLGNDAAHFESREFDQVSEKEVNVGIKFTKEILRALYQYDELLEELNSLKSNETK